jgi:LPS export ABC transporter protein LptC
MTLLLLFISAGCQKKQEEIPLADEGISTPTQKFANTTLHFFNKGKLQWKLEADYMSKPISDTGSITVIPADLTLFDSIGEISTRVLADSCIITNNMASYNVWGNVYIRTRDSMVVHTERLKWFKERKKVESDTFVQIETKNGDILQGIGLDATEDFSRFKFLKDVQGKVQNFQERVEENDTLF